MTDLRISNDYERKQLIEFISKLDLQKAWRVTVKQWREKRSLSQNNLAAKWYREAAVFFKAQPSGKRQPEEVMKIFFKDRFLGWEDVQMGSKVVSQLRHTSDLDVGEMFFYMSQIDSLCASKGCFLTKPENSQYMELLKEQEK